MHPMAIVAGDEPCRNVPSAIVLATRAPPCSPPWSAGICAGVVESSPAHADKMSALPLPRAPGGSSKVRVQGSGFNSLPGEQANLEPRTLNYEPPLPPHPQVRPLTITAKTLPAASGGGLGRWEGGFGSSPTLPGGPETSGGGQKPSKSRFLMVFGGSVTFPEGSATGRGGSVKVPECPAKVTETPGPAQEALEVFQSPLQKFRGTL